MPSYVTQIKVIIQVPRIDDKENIFFFMAEYQREHISMHGETNFFVDILAS